MPAQVVTPKVGRDPVVDAVLSASRVLVAVAARSLGDVAEEVTLTQYRTLVVLASRGPQSLAALAEAIDVTPPTATRMCDRLIRKGLVQRRHERGDRRLIRLSLSEKGQVLVHAVTERRRAEITDLLKAIPREQQTALVDSLQRLSAAAGEVPEQDWSAGWTSRCLPSGHDHLSANLMAGSHGQSVTLALRHVVLAEVAGARRSHRDDGRRGGHRLL